MAGSAAPFAQDHDGGERLAIGRTTIIVRAAADSTGGAFTVFEEPPPLLDASRHVHRHEDEL